MEKIFILRVGYSVLEPIRKNSNIFQSVQDGSKFMNVEDIDDLYAGKLWFKEYKTEDGKIVGASFGCNYGHGYGFDNGYGTFDMKPGDKTHFSYESTYVDDEGDPEEFSVNYYLELYDWDDMLCNQ